MDWFPRFFMISLLTSISADILAHALRYFRNRWLLEDAVELTLARGASRRNTLLGLGVASGDARRRRRSGARMRVAEYRPLVVFFTAPNCSHCTRFLESRVVDYCLFFSRARWNFSSSAPLRQSSSSYSYPVAGWRCGLSVPVSHQSSTVFLPIPAAHVTPLRLNETEKKGHKSKHRQRVLSNKCE